MRNEVIILANNNVEICAQSFGVPTNPALLLIMGEFSSMLFWEEDFCKSLSEQGFFVIRYDQRDTGKSITYPYGVANYSMEDLAEDAVAILNYYKIDKTHLLCKGLGGKIGQIIALKYPEKVLKIVLAMSSPLLSHELPCNKVQQEYFKKYSKDNGNNKTLTKLEAIEAIIARWRFFLGHKDKKLLNEASLRSLSTRESERSKNLQSCYNHTFIKTPNQYNDKINEIEKEVLVIHGEQDPLYSYENVIYFMDKLRNVKLLVLSEVGHILTLHVSQYVIDNIVIFLKNESSI